MSSVVHVKRDQSSGIFKPLSEKLGIFEADIKKIMGVALYALGFIIAGWVSVAAGNTPLGIGLLGCGFGLYASSKIVNLCLKAREKKEDHRQSVLIPHEVPLIDSLDEQRAEENDRLPQSETPTFTPGSSHSWYNLNKAKSN